MIRKNYEKYEKSVEKLRKINRFLIKLKVY